MYRFGNLEFEIRKRPVYTPPPSPELHTIYVYVAILKGTICNPRTNFTSLHFAAERCSLIIPVYIQDGKHTKISRGLLFETCTYHLHIVSGVGLNKTVVCTWQLSHG